jgi:hypothetical protein
MKKPIRIAVFDDIEGAERATSKLLEAGFGKEQISVIFPACFEPVDPGVSHLDPAGAHALPSALAGGTLGALLGGLTIVAGIVTTGGTALLAAGPLLLTSAAVGGGFVGAMLTRGLEPEIADYYDQALEKGKLLIALEDDEEERLHRAESILAAEGADPIGLTAG